MSETYFPSWRKRVARAAIFGLVALGPASATEACTSDNQSEPVPSTSADATTPTVPGPDELTQQFKDAHEKNKAILDRELAKGNTPGKPLVTQEENSRLLDIGPLIGKKVVSLCAGLTITGPNKDVQRNNQTTPINVVSKLTNKLDAHGVDFYFLVESSPDGKNPVRITKWDSEDAHFDVQNNNSKGVITVVAYDIASMQGAYGVNAQYPFESGHQYPTDTSTKANPCPVYDFSFDKSGKITQSLAPGQ